LIDFEMASKILLGAHFRFYEQHPLDYCYNSLNIRTIRLDKQHPEFKLINMYIGNTKVDPEGYIANVFAIERRGEAERHAHYKNFNRMLLWHGTRVTNLLSILG